MKNFIDHKAISRVSPFGEFTVAVSPYLLFTGDGKLKTTDLN